MPENTGTQETAEEPSLSLADAMKIELNVGDNSTPQPAPAEIQPEEVDDIAPDDNEPDEIDEEIDQEADADPEETDDTDVDDEKADEEAETEAVDEIIHTLADGTQLTADEVEGSYRREKDYHKKTASLADERRTFEAEAVTHRDEMNKTLDQLILDTNDMVAYREGLVPLAPDPALIHTDQQQYLLQEHNRNVALQNLEQMRQGQQYAVQQRDLQNQELLTQRRVEVDAKLVEMFPKLGLDDPENKAKFDSRMLKTAQTYGYTEQEYKTFLDPRGVKMARDAQKWLDHLSAQKTVGKKVANAKPVTKPGHRRARPNSQNRRQKKAVDRLHKSGTMADAMNVDFR